MSTGSFRTFAAVGGSFILVRRSIGIVVADRELS
jgi:hypothetical protein